SVSVRRAAIAGPAAAAVNAGAGPATATSAPPSNPPTIRPSPKVIELRPRALASRFGSTTLPAITSEGADQKPSTAPTPTARASARSTLSWPVIARTAPAPNTKTDVAWLRNIPRRGPSLSTNTPAGTIVKRVGKVQARKRKPTAVADPVSVRIVQERAVWNSQTVMLLAVAAA